jgi:agmatine/peptidylarginine deiminase
MLTWPHADTDWAPHLPLVEACYLQIARAIALREQLLLVCPDENICRTLKRKLVGLGCPAERLLFTTLPSHDTWVRDYAPITVLDNTGPCLKDFSFNGWGGRYPSALDDRVAAAIARQGCFGQTPLHRLNLVLEGGALDTDGEGSLLATRHSLLCENRNPDKTPAQVEGILSQELGLDRFLWLEHGYLSGDDTDGHIDTLARFCDVETIVYTTAHPTDPDARELTAMQRQLSGLKTRQGVPYRLLPLPAITPKYGEDGERLPASYANFLLINGALLLPVYDDPADRVAVNCLQACFPGRAIVPIDCRPLIRQKGSLHCCTMQFPIELELQPSR